MKTKDMKKISSVFVILFFLGITAFAQTENCSDGIDNDGDGLIDCADGDCVFAPTIEKGCNCEDTIDNDGDGVADVFDPDCTSYYGLSFVGDDTDCSVQPPLGTDFFAISEAPAMSSQNTVDTQSKMAIGDIDGDGIPDVVASSKWNQQVRVLATTDDQPDGSDAGDVKADFKLSGAAAAVYFGGSGITSYFDLELLVADIEGDGKAEIFSIVMDINNSNKEIQTYYLAMWKYAANSLEIQWGIPLGTTRPGIPGIADFDGDGLAEIYLKNRIYAAENGTLLADAGGDWLNDINSAPVAVNINSASTNLELVCGNYIYNVPSLASRSLTPISLWQDMNTLGSEIYYPKQVVDLSEYGLTSFSSTSVADFDKDGNIDVFITGAKGSPTGQTTVFYWNVANGTVSTFEPTHPDVGSVTYPNGWTWGTSRINLGDIDGDGLLEATFVGGNQLWALEEGAGGTLQEAWATPRTINDSKSGIINTTVYDFDNDGSPELVYRDAYELAVIDGATGTTTHWATTCKSHTMTEGPIIADVNNDGATDICVPCYTSSGAFDPADGYSKQALGQIRLYFSSNNAWLPTRKVWNQPGYFVVNIKDDLTVPTQQVNQNMNFGNDPCDNGIPGPNMPLNMFLNQVPNFSANGCPVYPGPDIAFVGDNPTLDPSDPAYVDPSDPSYFPAVEVIPPTCGDLDIFVNFNIINDGLRSITSDMGVSFWDGDPTLDPQPATPAALLHTETLVLNAFDIGDTLSFTGITVQSTGKAFTLYILLNDDGTNPLPVTIGGGIDECKIANNVYGFPITPDPFELKIGYITDNIKCEDTAPDNGEIRAVVYEGGVEAPDYSKYSFQWYIGLDTLTPMTGASATLSWPTGLADGAYTVVATNIAKGCKSLPIDTTIVRIGQDPIINFTTTPQTQCSPVNGKLEVAITGGNTGFTFSWRDGSLNDLGISSAIASDLAEGEYFVTVTKDGCAKTSSASVSGPTIPRVEPELTAGVFSCADPNTGAITAYALDASGNRLVDDSGYTYDWYYFDIVTNTIGSLLSGVHGTGKSRTLLPVGFYAVTTTLSSTQCESSVQIIEVPSQTKIPAVTLTQIAEQTSCDPNTPNGIITVAINYAGVPQLLSDFTIEWFKGDNVLPENKITTTSGTNGEFGESIVAGGIPYTVMVTSAFGCSITDTITIGETLIYPVVTLTPVINTICDPLLASATDYDGSMTASVTYDGVAVTDFTDYVFTWYDGSDIIVDPIIVGETGNVLSGIDAGDYTVIATYLPKSCASTQVTNTVLNVFDLPVIDIFNVVHETTCSGTTPNGSVTANVLLGGIPTTTGYTFEWYSGTDVTIPGNLIATTSGTKNETAFELDGGITYTVKTVNEATGCINTQSIPLLDNSINPSITLSKINNIVCDPALGYTGSVTAVLTDINGSMDLANDYTFTWYIGETATPGNEIADSDPSTPLILEGVDGNWYTLVISNNVLGCPSVPVKILVEDNPPIINIVVTNNIPSTNCIGGAPNGELAAAVDIATVAGYTFTWYEGVGTGGIQRSITETATALQGGLQYTVHVVQDATGCDNTLIVDLLNESEIPVVTMTTTENIGCAAGLFTGTAIPTITYKGVVVPAGVGGLDDYSFTWTGPNGYTSPDPTTISALENGDYTLTVTNTVLNCISLPFTATVGNNPAVISIANTNTPSTNCIPDTDPNGQIIADSWVDLDGNGVRNAGVEDDPLLFTYQWYTGTDTSTPIGGETNPTISTIQGGVGRNYTIETVHISSGCTQTYTVLLNDASQIPIITLTSTDNTICDPVFAGVLNNGTVTAVLTDINGTALGHVITDYTFAWTDAGGTPVPDGIAATPLTLDNVPGGDYNLVVTNDILGCSSLLVTTTVNHTPPVITLATVNTASTNCAGGDPNGNIQAFVDANANGVLDAGEDDIVNYTYEWHVGLGTGGASTATQVGNDNIAINLQGGATNDYTVRVIDNATGCDNTFSVLLPDASQIPTITLTSTDNTICDPVFANALNNGAVTAVLTDINGAALGHVITDYSFAWTDAGAAPVVDGDLLTPLILDNVPGGDYNLVVSNDILGCSSLMVTTTVKDTPPVITLATVNTASTNCAGGTPNGSIQAFVDANANGVLDVGEDDIINYTYEWYVGIGTGGANTATQVGNDNVAIDLQGGATNNYTVRVIDNATGCDNTFSVLLPDASQIPIITLTSTDNTICDPVFASALNDGVVTAVLTDINGAALGHVITDYSFAWTDAGGTPVVDGDLLTPLTLNNVPGGDYNLVVSNDILGCSSLLVTTTVNHTPPAITLATVNTASTNCVGGTPNGSIQAFVDANANGVLDVGEDNTATYTYEWHVGLGTGGANTAVGSDNVAINLQGGATNNYTVRVIDNATGCDNTFSVLLPDASQIPIITLTTTNNTICDPVFASVLNNGAVTAVLTDPNGVALGHTVPTNYTFTWTDAGGTPVVDGDLLTPLVLDNVPGGDYNLVVTNDILGCSSLLVTTTVNHTPPPITLATINTASTNCAGGAPNGSIQAFVDANANGVLDVGEDNTATYTYEWHVGLGTGGANTTVGTDNVAINLQGGATNNYTVRVIDNATGCDNTFSVLLPDASQIPFITLTSTDNTICDPAYNPYDGAVTAVLTDPNGVALGHIVPTHYTFTWTDAGAAPVVDGDLLTPLVLDNVPGGDYNLVVSNDVLGCSSLLVTTTVNHTPPPIILATVNTASTNCGGTPNGSIQAFVDANANGVLDVGEDNTATYTYEWYVGLGTGGANTAVGSDNVAINLQGGATNNYTVLVIDNATGCDNTFSVLLPDASQIPIITLTTTDNTICNPTTNPYDGTVIAVLTDPNGVALGHTVPANYTITWTDAGGIPVADGVPATPLTLDNVPSGDYNLVVSNDVLGCSSLMVTTTVNNNFAPITVFFTNTKNTSCAATGNGEILAGIDLDADGILNAGTEDVIGNLSDYKFTWHSGATTTGIPIVPPATLVAGNDNHIIQLEGNEFYTLEVERKSTGCVTTYTEWVQKVITTPIIDVTATSYSSCTDNVLVQAVITNLTDFAPYDNATFDFTYTWYKGSTAIPGNEILAPGVVDDPFSGQSLTTLDGVTELPAGNYTVIVTHNNSSCIAPERASQIFEPPALFDIVPTLDAAATTCGDLSGIAFVNVTANAPYVIVGNLTYDWYVGAPTNTAPGRYFEYVAGAYVQTDNVTSNSFYTEQEVTFGAGAIETDPLDDILGSEDANAVLSGVTDGLYTVVVTDDATGCREYITFQIPFADAQQNNIITVTPDTHCVGSNSSIEVEVIPDPLDPTNPLVTDYIIYLFAGSNPVLPAPTSAPVGFLESQPAAAGGNIFTALGTMEPGNYTIVSQGVNDPVINCFSVPTIVTIEEWAHSPELNLVGIVPNSSCDIPNIPDGQLTIDIQHNNDEEFDLGALPPILETTYEILAVPADGAYPNVTVGAGFTLGVGNQTLINLGPTDYTITITSSRGCSTVKTYSVPDQPVIAEVIATNTVNTTTCAVPNGSMQVVAINQVGTAIGFNTDDFEFRWTFDADGNGAFNDAVIYTEVGNGAGNGTLFDNTDAAFAGPGIYWVEIIALPAAGIGLGCPSAPYLFEILDKSVNPIFTYDVTANTACDLTFADASFFIAPERNSPDVGAPAWTSWSLTFTGMPADYVFSGGAIPTPASLTAPVATAGEAGEFTASGILPGQYDFTLTDVATGCPINGSLIVPDLLLPPVLDNIGFAVVDQFVCSPDGSITISQIETVVSGLPGPPTTDPVTAVDVNMANYTFKWYAGSVAPLNEIAGITDNVLDNTDAGFAGAGIYWVEITKIAANALQGGVGCTSAPYQFEIIDQSVDPIFTYDVTANTACDINFADASFYIAPDRNTPDAAAPAWTSWSLAFTSVPADYDLMGGAIAAPASLTAPVPTVGVAGEFTASGILPGQYDFILTDNATGCPINGSLIVPDIVLPPVLDNIGFAVIDQFVCSPDGSITISQIETVVSGLPGPPTTNPVTVVDVNMANYSFAWYINSVAPANLIGDNNNILDNTDGIDFLGAGTYFVEITKTGAELGHGGVGCTSAPYQFEIIDQSVNPIFTYDVTVNTACDLNFADASFFIDPDRNTPGASAPAWTSWSLAFTSMPADYVFSGGAIPTPASLTAPVATAGEAGVFTASGILPGQYDFILTDVATGCPINGSIVVPDLLLPPVLDNIGFTVVDQFICSSPPDGSITISQIETVVSGLPGPPTTNPVTVVDVNMANYSFAWYINSVAPANLIGDNNNILDNTDGIDFLGAGTYFVEITKTGAELGHGGVGCTSAPYQFEIIDQSVNPIFTYDVTANTACDLNFADASFFIDPDRNSPDASAPAWTSWSLAFISVPADYDMMGGAIAAPASLTAPVATAGVGGVFTASGILPGQYDFTLTDDASGCPFNGSLVVPDIVLPPVLDNIGYTVVDQFICSPDGSITISQIETVVSGLPGPPTTDPVTAIDVNMANYTFKWYAGAVAPANEIAGVTDNVLDNTDGAGFLGAGTYFVEITKIGANPGEGGVGCTSAPYQFEIIDQSVDPIFTYDVTANTACDINFADASFFIDPDRNTPDASAPAWTSWSLAFISIPADYDMMGGAIATPASLTAPVATAGVGGVFTASGILPGQYDFTLTDDASGCPFNGSLVVPDLILPPVLDNIGYAVVDQFICSPDGSITISQIETVVSGLPGPPTTSPVTAIDVNMANYDFTWYFDANFNGIFDDATTRTNIVGGAPGDGDIYQLGDAGFAGAGIYWVEITKIGAVPGQGGVGCTSAPYKLEIIDQSVNPIFTYDVTANTACDINFADASFFIDPDRNSPDASAPAWTSWSLAFISVPADYDMMGGAIAAPASLTAPVATAGVGGVFTASGILPGQYDFTLTDDASGCPINGSLVVPDLLLPPVLDNIGYAVADQFICSPDGSITISQIETVVSGLPGPPTTSPVTTIDVNMANYDFTWYFDANLNGIFDDPATRSNIIGGGATNGDIYQLGDAGFAGAGVYWVEVTKIGAVPGQGGVGCTSAPYKLEIIDQSVNPTFTYTTTANTSCDPAGADGTITLNLNRNGAVPAFTNWDIDFISTPYTPGSEPAPIDAIITQAGNILNVTGLLSGTYDFTITDLATGCINQASLVIPEYIIYPALLAADFTIVDQPVCSTSGSISVNSVETIESVTLNTVNDPVLSNYEFIWYVGADFNTAAQTYTDNGGSATNGEVYDNTDSGFIGAGTYWLQLRKIAVTPGDGGLGCISAPIQFIIDDVSVDPVIAFTQSSNTACNQDVNGQLTAFATTSGAPIPVGSIFTWYKGTDVTGTGVLFVDGTDGIIDQSVIGQETLTNVAPGTYSVVVTDLTTSCILSSSFEVLDQPEIPSLTLDNASIIHQDICYPSGSITVNDGDITLGGLPGLVADYEFIWTINSPNSAALLDGLGNPITGPVLDATTYPGMSAGSYYVSLAPVAGIGDGCFGPPVSVEVEDLTTDPIISFSTTVNSSCDNLNPNGQISAIVQEAGGIITGDTYSFVWIYNGNPLPGTTTQTDIGNISTLTDAGEGDYSVTVMNVSASGCTSSYGVTLVLDRNQSEPNIITVISTDPSDCNFTGSAEVTEIQVGGIIANVNNFTFEWYIGSVDPANLMLDSLGLPIQTAILSNIGPDKYYVKAKELVTKCESIAKEINVLDTNIIYPTLSISLDRPQTSCDLNNPSGQLSALADGLFDDTNPDYTFTWYSGTDISQPAIATGSTLTNVAEGEYTAQVYNALTNCSATAFYIIEDGRDEFKLQVSISTNPIYRCDINNGSAEARILNYPSGNFQFDWQGPNGYTGQGTVINNLAPGQYTVVATDLDGIYCPSLVKVGVVEDERENPIITLVETNPLTNCDPASPDGQLLASVNNQIGGYTFNWYAGGVATGSIIHTGNILSNLTSGTYTLQVVDDFTQCASEIVGEVTNGQLLPPTPLAEIINGQTSCIEDNGKLLASAVDNASVYYNWYNGSTPDQSPDHSMPDYSGLGLGDYTVTVTDTKTGCESEAITLSIEDETVYPEYTFRTNPANCETSNGYIEMLFEGEASIGEVIWYDNVGELSRSTNLYDQPAGFYDVSATTFLGCETTGSIEIATEITNYNGISANGDGLNDGFEIDCITMFPNNNVKIFNRAGVKIYEADNYNNDDVIFEGIGTNGIYLIGENVPDGTYFYIIDKGDGSRPKTGYLELMR